MKPATTCLNKGGTPLQTTPAGEVREEVTYQEGVYFVVYSISFEIPVESEEFGSFEAGPTYYFSTLAFYNHPANLFAAAYDDFLNRFAPTKYAIDSTARDPEVVSYGILPELRIEDIHESQKEDIL